jgi:WD40 repeat protein
VRVWDAASVAVMGEMLRCHEGEARPVALSADDLRDVSGGYDGTVRDWNAASSVAVGELLRGHEERVH